MAEYDPEWAYTPTLSPAENATFLASVRELVSEHLGPELASSNEMVEYTATLVAAHNKMRDIASALAEVLDGREPADTSSLEGTNALEFTKVLYEFSKRTLRSAVIAPSAGARIFSSAVAATASARQAAHPERAGQKRGREEAAPPAGRKVIVTKRGSAAPVAAPAASDESEGGGYTGVSRPPSFRGGRGGDSSSYRGRGGYRGRGAPRGGAAAFMPTPAQIQMALAIVSQMTGGHVAGTGAPFARGGMRGRGAPRGRGASAPSRGGEAAGLKFVSKSLTPCRFGADCFHAVCPYLHGDRGSTEAPRKSSKFSGEGQG
jgi:hypothetical protein